MSLARQGEPGTGSATARGFEARIERVVYGGYGLARVAGSDGTAAVQFVPYCLPGELVEALAAGSCDELKVLRVLEPSPERVAPGCPHFGVCGGCHLQMASYAEQLKIKHEVLEESLRRAGVGEFPEVVTHAAEPWGYRNRIRLHVVREEAELRLGYRERKGRAVVPITTCPIAAPVLWRTAEALRRGAGAGDAMRRWFEASDEVELFCDERESRVQVSLLCSGSAVGLRREGFAQAMEGLKADVPELVGGGAAQVNARTGQVQRELAAWGAAGLSYQVGDERYWIARGGFFQVNRFLLPELVEMVCDSRTGGLAWDLFAGVGLFARVLARRFERVTAVEANAAAARELEGALRLCGAQHMGVKATTIEFLRRAVVERERPELVVLDPPRAGAGREVCELLVRMAPEEVVYVSCDPVTLGRDLAVLQTRFAVAEMHLVDLFPQTYHQEAVVVLRRRS